MRVLHAFAVAAIVAASVFTADAAELSVQKYGAFVYWSDGTQVATGIVWNRPSEEKAVQDAKGICERTGVTCRVFKVWTDGCGFVATGTRRTGTTVGYGETRERAVVQCKLAGARCDKAPEGGCNSGSSETVGQQ